MDLPQYLGQQTPKVNGKPAPHLLNEHEAEEVEVETGETNSK